MKVKFRFTLSTAHPGNKTCNVNVLVFRYVSFHIRMFNLILNLVSVLQTLLKIISIIFWLCAINADLIWVTGITRICLLRFILFQCIIVQCYKNKLEGHYRRYTGLWWSQFSFREIKCLNWQDRWNPH